MKQNLVVKNDYTKVVKGMSNSRNQFSNTIEQQNGKRFRQNENKFDDKSIFALRT